MDIPVPKNIMEYWLDLCSDIMHDEPDHKTLLLYKSLNGIYLKFITSDKYVKPK